jgi:hypothetical protein
MNKFSLTRRSFLKAIGVGVVAVNLYPFKAAEAVGWPHFNPKHQYGDDPLRITDEIRKNRFDPLLREVISIMDEQIARVIPPKYRRHVEYIILNPYPRKSDPLSQVGVVAWKYSPGGKGGIVFPGKGWDES